MNPSIKPRDLRNEPFKLLSIVVPVYNELENLAPLYERLRRAVKDIGTDQEIIFVDDGSTDGTRHVLTEIAQRDPAVKLVLFRRNYGQTAALSAGFKYAHGSVIVAIDADLQNDPSDIPELVAKLEEGYELVSGWRSRRKDPLITRRIPSLIANKIISWIGGVSLKDYGCTLKAYRASFVKEIHLFGEMHRFIPIYAHWMGARIAEIPVRHHPRLKGKSKYGISRTFKVILDLVTVKFLASFSTKPIYFFGGAGFACLSLGFLMGAIALFHKIAHNVWIHRNPIFSIAIFFSLIGFQLILMGLLAEIVIRIYHESKERPTYWIQELINFKDETCAASQDL